MNATQQAATQPSSERPALPVSRTRAGRRAVRPRPMERDSGLALARLERAITVALAERECGEHCAQLSAYLDGLSRSACLDALAADRGRL